MTTTNDTHRTEWSLPVQADLPRDTLQAQLEVYGKTVLLRGFEADRTWVRTVSADEIANVFTRHLGFSSGLLPENTLWWNQGETGQVVALWRPPQVWLVALQREAFQPPARLRLPMPGLVFVCSPGRAPWVYAALERPTDHGAAALPRPGLQRLPGRASLPRQPPLLRGGGTDTRILLPVLLLPYRRQPGPVEAAPRQPASPVGGDRWKG